MPADRLHMRLTWRRAPRPVTALPVTVRVRQLSKTDEAAIGRLMWAAFRGTPDDQYAAPADAQRDAAQTVAGAWGPVVWDASLAAEVDSLVISAAIVVRDSAHDGLPLLAFALTDPGHQRRGIGQRLIEESIARLDSNGVHELHLAVTRGNPAARLYQRLGFEVVA
jgi:ribosomal protein S18 acetylase RimI-like enzyme